ncbi:hypothetical protein BDV33DRAFT_210801 [Aspergillus novoparasiticus]|uniref:Uncharacterized protein n=1 Tax=Aspergillus novoparasiticus TaxID=986946 RepID=A0A5N6E7T8_9EURO|nr:hypothetical protein BDV33DRAFT_210801 [Aspergillus novoparasiticus]
MKIIAQPYIISTLLLASFGAAEIGKDVPSSSLSVSSSTPVTATATPSQSQQKPTDVLSCFSTSNKENQVELVERIDLQTMKERTCQAYASARVGLDTPGKIQFGELCGELNYIADGGCPLKPSSFREDSSTAQYDCESIFDEIINGCEAAGGMFFRSCDCVLATLGPCSSIDASSKNAEPQESATTTQKQPTASGNQPTNKARAD